jgi:hypothetical protein
LEFPTIRQKPSEQLVTPSSTLRRMQNRLHF